MVEIRDNRHRNKSILFLLWLLSLKILYYTSGITGAGRVARGIAIANALKRKSIKYNYSIMGGPKFSHLPAALDVTYIEMPLENEKELSKQKYKESFLYNRIRDNVIPTYTARV